MKKEVILAIILGFGIGLIITFGIYTAQKAIQEKALPNNKDQTTQNPSGSETSHKLLLSSPQHENIYTEDSIQVVGTTSSFAHIIILTSDNNYITEADDSGHFSQDIPLKGGANTIKVTAIDDAGNETTEEVSVIFSTADLEEAENATPSADTKDSKETNETK